MMGPRVAALLAALAAAAGPVAGEPPARSLAELRAGSGVAAGEAVAVRGADGRRQTGRLLALEAERLVMEVGGARREIAAGDVREVAVRRADPVRNGMLIGALVGVPFAVLNARFADTSRAGAFAGTTISCGLIGAGVDALLRRDEVVMSVPGAAARGGGVRLAPARTGDGGVGVALAVRF